MKEPGQYEQPCSCGCRRGARCPCRLCGGTGVVVGNGSARGRFGAWTTAQAQDTTASAVLGPTFVTIKKRVRNPSPVAVPE